MDNSAPLTQTSDSTSQKKSLAETASGALSGAKEWFSGMFTKPVSDESTSDITISQPVVGGKKKYNKNTKSKKSKTTKRKHSKKGQASKTRKGKKSFITHKGDMYYNRNGHRQTKSRSGKKGRPYGKRH